MDTDLDFFHRPLWVPGFWAFLLLGLFWPTTLVRPQTSAGEHPRFLGVQSCASSGCHGSAKENFDQVFTWERRDQHTRAFATLTTARSARMAEALQIRDAAQSPRCASCHAPLQEVTARQPELAAEVRRGVSCENCHGPAEHWLRTHTRLDLIHEEKVAAGMRDLRNFYIRANTCVACHQNVEPDLLQAGHPELIFELDGQCVTEPRHWRERRGDYGPALWLTGQAVALREMSWHLSRQKEASPQDIERWHALVWLLNHFGLTAGAPPPPDGDAPPAFIQTQRLADDLARAAATSSWPAGQITGRLKGLIERSLLDFADAQVPKSTHARRAERLVLAVDRLAMALPAGSPAGAARHEIDRLFQAAQSLPDFDPALFRQRLAELQRKLP